MGPFFALGHLARPARLGRRAAVDRRGAGAQRVGDGAPARRARRAPARRRPPGRRAALHAQPVRRHLRGADVDHAAGHGGAAVAAAVRAPRAARPPRLVVAGGLRARADLDRRRGQRRRHRVAAARPGPAGGLRAGLGRGARRARRARSSVRLVPVAALASPVVGRRRARPRALRPGLPALHRAAGDDLEHDVAARVAAAAGLLDELHRRRATRAPCAPSRPTPASIWGSRRSCVATLAIPALCLGSFAWTRRARYAPVLPRARPPRPAGHVRRASPRGRRCAARRPSPTTTCRPCASCARATRRGRSCRSASRASAALAVHALRPHLRAAALVGAAALVAVACWPLARGVGLDRQLGLPHGVPAAWRDAAHDLDRTLPPGQRAMVLPGQLFAFYDWGGTYDPILPGPDRPARGDALHRALRRPARRRPAMDDRRARQPAARRCPASCGRCSTSWASAPSCRGPTTTARAAAPCPPPRRPGSCARLGPPARAYGPPRTVPGAAGTLEPAARLPQVRRWNVPTAGLVRVLPRDGATVVDGSAPAIADLAAFGALRTDRALHYAADLDEAALRAQAARGASFVISDSNRRRVFVAARLRGNTGWTVPARRAALRGLGAARPVPAPRNRRADRRARRRRGCLASTPTSRPASPSSPSAVRSRRSTATRRRRGWPTARWPPIATTSTWASRRRATSTTSTSCPTATARAAWTASRSTGASSPCATGGTGCTWACAACAALSVQIAHVVQPPTGEGGAGGIRELRIPGVRATEALRPPLLVEHALHGADLRRAGLTYLFDRTTGDDPLRPHVVTGARSRGLVRDQQDGERGWARAIAPPAARAWRADAWVSVAPETPDHVLDSWVGCAAAPPRLRRLLALRGPGSQPRLVGLRRRSAARVDRRLDPLARRVASVAHASAADDPDAAARARPGARALPDPRARGRRRPRDGAAGRGGRRQRGAAGAVARAHRAHRGPGRRLPARHARHRPRAPRGRRGGGERRRRPARHRVARRRSPAALLRRWPDAAPRHAGRAPARRRERRGDRRRPPAARDRLRRPGRAARRAADGPRGRRAVAPGPRAPHLAGGRERAHRRWRRA